MRNLAIGALNRNQAHQPVNLAARAAPPPPRPRRPLATLGISLG